MKISSIFIISFLVLMGACAPKSIEDFADEANTKIATKYIQFLFDENYDAIISDLDPMIKKGNEKDIFSKMRSLIPSSPPASVNLTGYTSHKFYDIANINVTYQYEYEDKWLLINVAFRKLFEKDIEIKGFRITPLSQSLQEFNKFTFKGKGFLHYIFLLLCISNPIFIVISLIVCIRTRLKSKKWLWIIFILIGTGKFSLNWTTGQIGVQFLSIQLLGSGAVSASSYAPWIIMFSLPVGAFLFWFCRSDIRIIETSEEEFVNEA